MEIMICPKCGNEVAEGDKFCSVCGTPQKSEAPMPEPVNAPESEEKAPMPETEKIPETENKVPVPDNGCMDYSYEPQSYTVENGNSQGAGALVVFLLVLAMLVVSLVVCMIMSASAFVNKSRKQTEKDFSVSPDKSYSYNDYDDDDYYDDYYDDGYDDYYGDDYDDYEDHRGGFFDDGIVWNEDDQKPMDGFYKSGDYKVGENIPAGTYFLKANVYRYDGAEDAVGYRSITAGDDELVSGWFDYTCYVNLKEGDYFHISHCGAFDISKCPIENDPFEHPGTFMVGTDVEPGTYELIPVKSGNFSEYAVYESAEDIGVPFWVSDSKALYYGEVYGGEEITLEEGQFLELANAVLVRSFEATADGSDE